MQWTQRGTHPETLQSLDQSPDQFHNETNAVLDERNTDEQDVVDLWGEWAQLTVSTGNGNLPNLEKEWHTVKSFNTNYTKNLVLCGH